MRQFGAMIVVAMPDVQWHYDEIRADGDTVFTRWHGSGAHKGAWTGIPATGKTLTWRGLGLSRIRDGKLAEDVFEFDGLSFYRQMGVQIPIPEDASPASQGISRAMAGDSFR